MPLDSERADESVVINLDLDHEPNWRHENRQNQEPQEQRARVYSVVAERADYEYDQIFRPKNLV